MTTSGEIMKIVAMDVDRTLIRGQSQFFLLRRLARHGLLSRRFSLRVASWFVAHRLGWTFADPSDLQRRVFSRLKGVRTTVIDRIFSEVVNRDLLPRLRQDAVATIEAWKRQGASVVLVSATIEPLVSILAEAVGADAAIATRLADGGENFSGEIVGEMVMGERKWEALRSWADSRGVAWSLEAAYGDDASDRNLFERARCPVAVNPSRSLSMAARSKGWPIVLWR